MNRIAATVAALALSTSIAGAASAAETMRCSHQLPPPHHIAKVIDRWAAEVEKLSGGEIDVQVFGADSLVKAKDNILSTAKGDIECAFSLNFQWGKTLPLMNVTLGPYTMSSIAAWKKWPTSEAAAFLEEKLSEKGVKNVAGDDLPKLFVGSLGTLGVLVATVSMPGSEVYQALAAGVIDAAITDVAAAWSRKYYEVQDHMTVVPVLAAYVHGYVNPAWYATLSDKSKAALKQAGEEAAGWAIEASQEAAAAAPDQLAGKGVKVHVATDAENAAFKAIMQPAYAEGFEKETGAEGKKLLDLIAKIQ